jgi:hypothetical protein
VWTQTTPPSISLAGVQAGVCTTLAVSNICPRDSHSPGGIFDLSYHNINVIQCGHHLQQHRPRLLVHEDW